MKNKTKNRFKNHSWLTEAFVGGPAGFFSVYCFFTAQARQNVTSSQWISALIEIFCPACVVI